MPKKKLSDLELTRAGSAGDEKAGTAPSTSTATYAPAPYEPKSAKYVTTTVHIPEETLKLLKSANTARMISRGYASSVSRLITDLIESQRAALETEIKAAKKLL